MLKNDFTASLMWAFCCRIFGFNQSPTRTQMNRYEEIQKMLQEQPDDNFLHYALALECVNMGQVENGTKILENLRQKAADYLPLYYKLGSIYGLTGNESKAVEVYEAGIRLAEDQQNFKTRDELKQALHLLTDKDDFE